MLTAGLMDFKQFGKTTLTPPAQTADIPGLLSYMGPCFFWTCSIEIIPWESSYWNSPIGTLPLEISLWTFPFGHFPLDIFLWSFPIGIVLYFPCISPSFSLHSPSIPPSCPFICFSFPLHFPACPFLAKLRLTRADRELVGSGACDPARGGSLHRCLWCRTWECRRILGLLRSGLTKFSEQLSSYIVFFIFCSTELFSDL